MNANDARKSVANVKLMIISVMHSKSIISKLKNVGCVTLWLCLI